MSFNGHFVWHELRTMDAAAAQTFYCNVVGWQAQDSGLPGLHYTRLMLGETPAAGLMALPPAASAAGASTAWVGYVGVEDVDAMAGRVQQAGGALLHPAMDIPGIGRIASVADPHGAAFALFQPASAPPEGGPLPPGTPGTAGWHELRAGDGDAAFAFYSGLFGWQKGEGFDMGPMGTYQIFTVAGVPVGGIMTKMDPQARPAWQHVFNIAGIEQAAASVKREGGQVTHGPMQVPGGNWVIHCTDPQGGAFSLVAPPS